MGYIGRTTSGITKYARLFFCLNVISILFN